MPELAARRPGSTRWDLVSVGEVMLRLDPGDRRISTTRSFDVWEGGGEYNVARGLHRCFGMRTGVVTALVDNPVGRLIEDLMYQGGVDQAHLGWLPHDGVGRAARNGLNFTERGFGLRGAVGCSDRGHSAASKMAPGQIDWGDLLVDKGTRWLHSGGIFCALSESTAEVALEGFRTARELGTVVSYDLNYRPSLWAGAGGPAKAAAVNRELVRHADVLLGNEEDFSAALGFRVGHIGDDFSTLDPQAYGAMFEEVLTEYPNLKLVAATLRTVHSATSNDWSAVCHDGAGLIEGTVRQGLEIYDRVGGGDSFASGLIFGLLTERGPQESLEIGLAHGALAMTTPGDTSMATLAEVMKLVEGGSVRIER